MKSGYINEQENDEKMAASTYKAVITYDDGSVKKKEIVQYSFADTFEAIKESHEGEFNRKANIGIKRAFLKHPSGCFYFAMTSEYRVDSSTLTAGQRYLLFIVKKYLKLMVIISYFYDILLMR